MYTMTNKTLEPPTWLWRHGGGHCSRAADGPDRREVGDRSPGAATEKRAAKRRCRHHRRDHADHGGEGVSGDRRSNIGWKDLPDRWTDEEGNLCGKGIACFNKLTGTPSTTSVLVKMNENGSLYIMSASTEMGQGVTTTLPQIAAETLGMALEKISMAPVDTAITPYDKTTTPLAPPSLRQCGAGGLRGHQKQLCRLAAIKFGVAPEDVTNKKIGIRPAFVVVQE